MKPEEVVAKRSNGNCEFCGTAGKTSVYEIPSKQGRSEENLVMLCDKCIAQVDKKEALDGGHWKILSESMWSEIPGIQVLSWRMLNRLRNESWATDLLDMLYLDEEKLHWAKESGDHVNDNEVDLHKDAYGAQLFTGDTVVLTKSLDVKGSNVNARVGTVIRNIRLVPDHTDQIEGKIESQTIVVLTKYVRRQGS